MLALLPAALLIATKGGAVVENVMHATKARGH
jgi:hypothetical protein